MNYPIVAVRFGLCPFPFTTPLKGFKPFPFYNNKGSFQLLILPLAGRESD